MYIYYSPIEQISLLVAIGVLGFVGLASIVVLFCKLWDESCGYIKHMSMREYLGYLRQR